MLFKVNNQQEKMRITSAGNVGIGTTSPSGALDVVGTQFIRPITYASNQNGAAITFAASNNSAWDDDRHGIRFATDSNGVPSLRLRVNGSDRLTALSDGNVGIGSTSPGEKFTIGPNGGGDIGFHIGGHRLITFGYMASNGNGTTVSGFPAEIRHDPTNGFLRFGIDDTTRSVGDTAAIRAALTINNGGNVGIGTTSPATKLEVNGDIGIGRVAGGYTFREVVGGNERASMKSNSANELIFSVAGAAEQMRINSAGKVGIGTGSPAAKLHVVGKTVISSNLGIGTTTPKLVHIKNSVNDDSNVLLVEAAGTTSYGVYLKSAFSSQMGRVGAMSQADGDLDGASIAFEAFGRDIAFRTNEGSNNSEKARLLANGNFGIGTTAPAAKLHVVGDVIVSGNSSFQNRPTVNGTGVLLSGEGGGGTIENVVFTTGDQEISGVKNFSQTIKAGKITLSQNSFVTETGNFTLGATHKGATVFLQNPSSITITAPAQTAGYVTTFIAETQNTVSFATGAGMSGLNSFAGASDMAGIFAQAQIIYKSSSGAFLGGNIV
jgi:hypothetical protein